MRQNKVQKYPLCDIKTMKNADRGIVDSRGNPDTGVVIVRWNDNSAVMLDPHGLEYSPTGVVSCWSQDRQQIQYLSQEASL
ncbi:PiggyBac transposable element-derived protein 1 [Plakobranchus ocellatus]|uniref:PiggyBac transposable element-derived protein 1 n=1 Tax=Plakobranchus ocellatus TaxID=259542 RepID=A0AAV4B7J0_9GAST|nr:PiggyBac transposable element-derived protein 1 [Plakobranchus ocellatus]